MATLVPVTLEDHRSKSWRSPSDYRFAGREIVQFIALAEAPRLLSELPLAFVPQEEGFDLVAITGVQAGANLMIGPDGQWLGEYAPFQLRAYPFTMIANQVGDRALFVVEDSGLVQQGPNGHPFYATDGAMSLGLKELMDRLIAYEQGRVRARHYANKFQEAGLLEPWPITIDLPSGPCQREGFYKINEAALESLDGEAFLALRDNGALNLAYCQILSTQRLSSLARRAKTHAAQQALARSATGAMELDFSRFAR